MHRKYNRLGHRRKKYFIALLCIMLSLFIYYIKIWPFIGNTDYLGPEVILGEYPTPDWDIPMETHSQIMDIIVDKIALEDYYKNAVSQETIQLSNALLEGLQEDFELVIKEVHPPMTFVFNATEDYAKGLVNNYPPSLRGGTVVVFKNRISLLYSAPNAYWTVISNPILYRALKRINNNMTIEMLIVYDGQDADVYLEDDYSMDEIQFRYSKSENHMLNILGMGLADHWSLISTEIPWDLVHGFRFQDDLFTMILNGTISNQSEEYQIVSDIFYKNKEKIDYVIKRWEESSAMPEAFHFLGRNWKKQLEYIQKSDFLKAYSNYYFLDRNANEQLYKQISEDKQLNEILNQLGTEREISSIYNDNGCIHVRLLGSYLEKRYAAELYYIKNMHGAQKDKYVNNDKLKKIDTNWYLGIIYY